MWNYQIVLHWKIRLSTVQNLLTSTQRLQEFLRLDMWGVLSSGMFAWIYQYASCLFFSWFPAHRTSHQSPCRVRRQCYYFKHHQHSYIHMPRWIFLWSWLARYFLFMGFRPSRISCVHVLKESSIWWRVFLRRLELVLLPLVSLELVIGAWAFQHPLVT